MDTFIKTGDRIALSCDKGIGGPHRVLAVREPSGNISKVELYPLFLLSGFGFGVGLVLSFIPLIFLFAFMSPGLVIAIWFAFGALSAWGFSGGCYKALNALDSKAPSAETSAP
ncbi:hypothetical protein B8W72_30920 [Pseudomonas putida]|uniref:Uncharacterized protein n=1 Tax=Pseudomonas putida TaxID=303 RepID=A0A1Y3KAJ5_PSEPU|nr:hypothetical protein B8W72_30920 [Pseudomonas putida]